MKIKTKIDRDTYKYILRQIRNLKGYKKEREELRKDIIDSSPRNV